MPWRSISESRAGFAGRRAGRSQTMRDSTRAAGWAGWEDGMKLAGSGSGGPLPTSHLCRALGCASMASRKGGRPRCET